jgi:hypothetical protein
MLGEWMVTYGPYEDIARSLLRQGGVPCLPPPTLALSLNDVTLFPSPSLFSQPRRSRQGLILR